MIKVIHLQCSCHQPQHLLRITLITSQSELPELYIEPLLNPNVSFFKRIYFALRYIFKVNSTECLFDEVVLNKEEVDKLTTLISTYNLNYKYKNYLKAKKESKQ